MIPKITVCGRLLGVQLFGLHYLAAQK